ncbi:MAG: methionyl-tRNA formyltransferase, partial [Actinomycetota bacterium]
MKVLLASSSALANPVLEYLQNSTLELIGVITSPDVPRGRGREISENELAISARAAGLPVFKPNTHDEIRDLLISTEADLVVTLAYGRLIRTRELELPRYGWLNIHFSILPRWRGAAPAQRALEAGDEKTGVTVFRLDAGLDTGPLFAISEYVV